MLKTELWDKNTYGWEVKWAPEFIVSNNGGFGFSLNPVYCCLYFMYNFIFLFFIRCCVLLSAFTVHRISHFCSFFFFFFFFRAFCFVLLFFSLLLSTTSSEYGARTKNTDWRWVREFGYIFPLSISHSLVIAACIFSLYLFFWVSIVFSFAVYKKSKMFSSIHSGQKLVCLFQLRFTTTITTTTAMPVDNNMFRDNTSGELHL